MTDESIRCDVELIQRSDKILVFVGAGLSTESGIPDFRSPGGVWDKYDPSDFYFQRIISSESAREKYWQMSTEFWDTMKDALPSRGHYNKDRISLVYYNSILGKSYDGIGWGFSEVYLIEYHRLPSSCQLGKLFLSETVS